MSALVTWPSGPLATVLVVVLLVLLAGFGFLAWHATVLFKLGMRDIPRRWARAVLIVFGLTLSTTVIGSALGTGDTMANTVRTLVTESLGPVDEVVMLNTSSRGLGDVARAVAQHGIGGLAEANLGLFGQEQAATLAEAAEGHGTAAVVPAILDQVTVVLPARQQLQSAVSLIAVPAPIPRAMGQLRTVDGQPIDFGALGPNAIVLNTDAAALFGIKGGEPVRIVRHRVSWDVRVAAVVRDGGLGGLDPVVLVPLDAYQAHIDAPGQINAVLVANGGGVGAVARSDEVSQALRLPLADQAAVRQIHAFLHQPEVQRTILAAEGQERGRDRARIDALRLEAAKPEVTERFVSLISAPRTRAELGQLALIAPGGETIFAPLRQLSPLTVLDIKQEALNQATDFGSVVTTAFLVLGIFSIAAGLILIFLIFQLLAADRLTELATLRALGMSRLQILGMFLFEGLLYDLLGATLGALLGLAATLLTTRALASALAGFGFTLRWHVAPRSLLLAFSLGALLTFATMAFAAWRASNAGIVAATRGEARDESRAWLLGLGMLLVAAAGLIWWRWHAPVYSFAPRSPLVLPGALTLALLGLAVLLTGAAGVAASRLQPGAARRLELAAGAGATLLGLALAGVWARALIALPTPGGDLAHDALTIAVGGVVLLLAATWAATRAIGPALRLLDRALAPLAALRAVVRPAIGALNYQRWRTGLAVVMFGLVIFIMVTALVMIGGLLGAYSEGEPPVAGFAVQAQVGQPLDLPQALTTASAVSDKSFSAIGGTAPLEVQAVQLGTPLGGWLNETLVAVDDGFLQGVKANLVRRAPGYESTGSIWRALRQHPGTAVISPTLVGSGGLTVPPVKGFDPLTLWVRPDDGGQPVKLTVIGVIDSRSQLPPGVYTSRATAAGLGVALPAPSTYYLQPRPGLHAADAVTGLRLSFAGTGLSVTALDDQVQTAQSIRLLLTRIVQGFMGLGLIAGVAALGMLGVQAVIERRAQLGTLRALGFTRWQSRATLAFESAVIALLGVALGVVLGLILSHSLVALLGADHPELRYVIPWSQIAVTATLALAGSALASAAAIWQAGRVSPADALRAGG
ncbi:MAG TPA: ABC transporter permease [Thermomicrobiaceae bacterium]|nr:ABC transporter permease [Thermomicrobiaceae bacterium]